MLFGLYFGNLLFYVTSVVLLVQGGAALARWMQLKPRTIRILLAVASAMFAPALASLGHLLVLVPFVAFPQFYVISRALLPWNIGVSILTVVAAVLIYDRGLRTSLQSKAGRSAV